MRSKSGNTVLGLFIVTLVLGGVAIFIGTGLERQNVTPEESEASGCSCSCNGAAGSYSDKYCGKLGESSRSDGGKCYVDEKHCNALATDGGQNCNSDHEYTETKEVACSGAQATTAEPTAAGTSSASECNCGGTVTACGSQHCNTQECQYYTCTAQGWVLVAGSTCGNCSNPSCGNGTCDPGEDCSNCRQDCEVNGDCSGGGPRNCNPPCQANEICCNGWCFEGNDCTGKGGSGTCASCDGSCGRNGCSVSGEGIDCKTNCNIWPSCMFCRGYSQSGCGDAHSSYYMSNSSVLYSEEYWCSTIQCDSNAPNGACTVVYIGDNGEWCVTDADICQTTSDRGACSSGVTDTNGDGRTNQEDLDWNCEGLNNPKGYHDLFDCYKVWGWACDGDDYNTALEIHIYDGQAGAGGVHIGTVTANEQREVAVGDQCGGNRNHGFTYNLPSTFIDGRGHTIYTYAINIGTGENTLLSNSPRSLDTSTCVGGPECGNGECDSGETCDMTVRCVGSGVFTPGECRTNCTYCGDGIRQTGEQCDDGNSIDGDFCSNSCINFEMPYCGNGILEPGEECEPGIPSASCGPGGNCHPIDCICIPGEPGLCGSACATDLDCPSDNGCYNGFCRLLACIPNQYYYPYSGPFSNPYSSTYSGPLQERIICTPDGCGFVACGTICGEGGICPAGYACNEDNICVLPYCLTHECDDPCILPPTALIGDQIDLIIFSILLVIIGVLAYRFDLVEKGWLSFKQIGGRYLIAYFDKYEKRKIENKSKKRSRENFEKRFSK